ncbi:hypothetical protein I5V32_03125 [Stenotrophomonas maltophilia]|uniref:hypothetical protein n=1 Tax=Stenotrophomonas TaxID=40323 RepID=UPI0006C0533B|nr:MULTISPECIES: hypothetical protein [Stenotrophomonas]KOO75991.1 hypothetical protein VL21_16870 [Stenotrophomonas maltophilia]MBH1583079.1 hypothetical protein [Stenotrophomonas maltophilia]MBH1715143.1 hypothetical protein [Stenotrophomonas maltophilia]MCR1817237.1 hypothetical protein [Stenotrophomonas muris]MDG9972283.1 hypothetical protein [Stenotrophomonas sp. GD04032]
MSDIERQRRMRERAREQRKRELQTTRDDALGVSPLGDNKVVSENTKEALKTAGHWAGVIGKRAAELTHKGVAAAAEKAKEAKAQLDAKRLKTEEERLKATKAKSSTLTVQPAKVDVVPNFLMTDTAGSLVADRMAQDHVRVNGDYMEDKASFEEMAAEDLVEALSVHEPAAIAGEADAVEVGEAVLVAAHTEPQLVVEAPGLAQELNALSDLPGEALVEPQVTDDVSIGQSELALGAVEEPSNSPDGTPPEIPQASLQSKPRFRWPWVVGGVVAVALVAVAIYFLQEKNDQPPPSAPAPVAPVATPVVPEQLPEVVEAPVIAPSPALLSEQARPEPTIEKPEPVVGPVVADSARKEAQPKPSTQRAPATMPKKVRAPVSEPKSDWQQKANADLDAWAKKSGIK